MELLHALRIRVHANRLANHRLHAAMAGLSREDFLAPRTSFFPSLAGTLNHILAVDRYYIAALHREPDMATRWKTFVPCESVAELAAAQAREDLRFLALVSRIEPAALDEVIELQRTDHVQRERLGHVIAHLLDHQIHHRGQAHAMLAGTAVKPPQLDEFLMPSEAHLRTADMAALGWSEAAVYGPSTGNGS